MNEIAWLVFFAFICGVQAGVIGLWKSQDYLNKREIERQKKQDQADMDEAVELTKERLGAEVIDYSGTQPVR